MSRLDAVIFGATGFTGKYTVIHMIEIAKKYNIGAWGVAGRSEKKLNAVMKEVAEKTGADVSNVKMIIADVGDEKSMKEMCAQTKVVINCCGPYRLYGEPVVKAAIENKAHYVDVSGEPQFMELMQLRYDELAREAGVYVISACGWDSIPADMGVVFLQKNFGGTLNSVKSYLNFHVPPEAMAKAEGRGIVNYGTWESLVYGLAHYSELRPLRKKLYPEPLPSLKPKLYRQIVHKKEDNYYLPFLGSDESVVYRSQRYIYSHDQQRPVQFKAYVKSGTILQTIAMLISAIFLFILSQFRLTRSLLLKYPELFSLGNISRKGPTEAVMNNCYFEFKLVGEGWREDAEVGSKPTKEVTAKVSGMNPGYGATCLFVLMSAVSILQEREKMPENGGVVTTGAVFRNTNLIKNLTDNNLKYEIVATKDL